MFRFLLALAAVLCVATSCGANNATQLDVPARGVSAVNATNAWNSVCVQHNFIPKPFDTRITFAMGYYGSNFATDFANIKLRVNQLMGAAAPTDGTDVMGAAAPTDGSDVMRIKIENWTY